MCRKKEREDEKDDETVCGRTGCRGGGVCGRCAGRAGARAGGAGEARRMRHRGGEGRRAVREVCGRGAAVLREEVDGRGVGGGSRQDGGSPCNSRQDGGSPYGYDPPGADGRLRDGRLPPDGASARPRHPRRRARLPVRRVRAAGDVRRRGLVRLVAHRGAAAGPSRGAGGPRRRAASRVQDAHDELARRDAWRFRGASAPERRARPPAGEARRRGVPFREAHGQLPHVQLPPAAEEVLRGASRVFRDARRKARASREVRAVGLHPAVPHEPGRAADRHLQRAGGDQGRPHGGHLRREPERQPPLLPVSRVRGGGRGGGKPRRHGGALRERRRGGGGEALSRRDHRDARLPVLAQAAEEDAPAAQRDAVPLLHRVRLPQAARRESLQEQRRLRGGHPRLDAPDGHALPLGLHHELPQLPPRLPQHHGPAGKPEVLPREQREVHVRAGRLARPPRRLRRTPRLAAREVDVEPRRADGAAPRPLLQGLLRRGRGRTRGRCSTTSTPCRATP